MPILQHTLLWMWVQEEERQQREGLDHDAPVELALAEFEKLQARREVGNALSRHGNKMLDGMSPRNAGLRRLCSGA